MAIAALVLWMLTVAAGVYLLATSTRREAAEAGAGTPALPAMAAASGPAPSGAAPSGAAASGPVASGAAAGRAAVPAADKRDRFDPPSLRAAKSEPIPGLRALGEFTHPALAITGFAFWLLYTMTRDRIFGVIALGVLLGAIAAGTSWAFLNGRAEAKTGGNALSFSRRVLAFHVAGAALTLLLATLSTARV